jgi:hypothetical protein
MSSAVPDLKGAPVELSLFGDAMLELELELLVPDLLQRHVQGPNIFGHDLKGDAATHALDVRMIRVHERVAAARLAAELGEGYRG